MKPVTFTHTGLVPAPMDRVWEILTNPARIHQWYPTCHHVAPKDQPMRKGQVYHLEVANKRHRIELEVIEFYPPSSFGLLEHLRRAGSKIYFALGFSGGATRLTVKFVWTPKGFRSWLNGQFYRRRDAWRSFNGILQNLRKLVTR